MIEHPSMAGLPDGEPVLGKTYRTDGWAYYCPLGFMIVEVWNELLSFLGEGNYVCLAMTRKGDNWVRGQLLISPQGMDRIKNRKRAK